MLHFESKNEQVNDLNDIKRYVMPIMREYGNERSFAGTAFCIDDYLVTAGHVLQNPATYYVRNGNDYHILEFGKWIPEQLPASDRTGYDIALYPVPGLRSPLSLAEKDSKPNDELDIVCWQLLPSGLKEVITRGLVIKEHNEKDYIRIATVEHITHGCSGCPAFDSNGRVFGMITMGRHANDIPNMPALSRKLEQNTCWAFKSSHIRRFMP